MVKGKPGKSGFQASHAKQARVGVPIIPSGVALLAGKIKLRYLWIISLAGLIVLIAFAVLGVLSLRGSSVIHMTESARFTYFTSDQRGHAEIYYLNLKVYIVQVTQTPGPYGSWSLFLAANRVINFTSNQSKKEEIYYLNLKGHIIQVTHTPGLSESWISYLSKSDSGTPRK